jgi:uncharacterized membrane protein YeaQ/YmgE (transglycosylase-associated protein family)
MAGQARAADRGCPRGPAKDTASMLNLIGAIISGFFLGALARWFYPGDVETNWLITVLLGIGGSMLAGLITASRSQGGIGQGVSRAGCLASVLGGMALIFIGRQFGWV